MSYEYFNLIISGNFENIALKKITNSFIKYAWMAGIISFMLGIIIASIEIQHDKVSIFSTGKGFCIVLKVVNTILLAYYLGGFVAIGSKLKNHILVITSLISIFLSALFSFYDIVSLFSGSIDKQTIDGGKAITFGIIGIAFGIGYYG